jgi:signal transduction histidine kinase
VLSLTDLARRNLPCDHPVHEDLKRITEAGEQAANLASQLLALGKQRPRTTRRIEINQVIRRTLELLRATLPMSIRIDPQLCPEHVFVQADETQIQQVLMNLCLNARDAMSQGGLLGILTKRETVENQQLACLVVEDSGSGMTVEVRERIFEPFFSTKEGGTGLGLAVVQQIVESYGGRIEVISQPGAGSRFEVCWPALQE